jgi:hypothetical protein
MKRKNERNELTGESFDALPDAEKERIFEEIERESPQERLARSKPLTAAQRAHWQRIKRELKRTKSSNGRGVKVISVGVEPALLKRADAYAKVAGLTRAQLITSALKVIIGSAQ